MKILFCIYHIMDYGGITSSTEELNLGFRELGHHCDLVILKETDRDPYLKKHSTMKGGEKSSFENATVNAECGWGGVYVWSYANEKRTRAFRKMASKYDLILWSTPVPSWSRLHLVEDWTDLYKMKVPQVAYIRDGNFRFLYPHLNAVSQYLSGVACVHEAAYESARMYNGPHSLIPNPFPPARQPRPWDEKFNVTVCAHMWKAWKHMDVGVRAAPFLEESRILFGGNGIERKYMMSKEKCRPRYMGIWDAMLESGNAKYVHMIPRTKLLQLYDKYKVMLDPSYSVNYNKLGSHFNRSVFEAYNSGMIPVVMESNMQFEPFFEEGKTHIGLDMDMSPEDVAKVLDEVNTFSSRDANRIVSRGRKLLDKYFRRTISAQNILNLAKGKPCGVFGEPRIGKPSKQMKASCQDIMSGKRPSSRNLEE